MAANAENRKFFVGGNWKMNGSFESIAAIISFLSGGNISPNSGKSPGKHFTLQLLIKL